MPKIIPFVEGAGDQAALPLLLRRILYDQQEWQWQVGKPYQVHNLGTLKKYLPYYLQRASNETDCAAILIELDLDNGCPKEEAEQLAEQIRKLNLVPPVAIVFAHREYETWFLASLPTIAGHYNLPANLTYDKEVEAKRGAKEWLDYHMRPQSTYKERFHQAKFSQLIDIELAYDNSRSFQRLYDAVAELLEAAEKGERGVVTPLSE